MLQRAFEVAVAGVPGPVFLEIPVDVLYPKEMIAEWYFKESGVEKMKGPMGAAATIAMKGYLQHQFHTPHLSLPRLPEAKPRASDRQLRGIASELTKANKPVLVIGNQAMVNTTPEDAATLTEAIESLGIPTFLGGSSRGLLGRNNALQFRHKRTAALKESDLIIVAGFPFDFRLGYGMKINKQGTLVSINLDAKALKKNRRPDWAIQAHPGKFLINLAKTTGSTWECKDSWLETLRNREEARDAEIAGKACERGPLIDPVHLFMRIEEKIADDSVLIVDGGDFVATGAYIVRPRAPLSWLDPGVFGTLGVGGGFAIGASSMRPNAEVWLFYGDGSSGYSLAEFDTYVRHGYAPIAVIGTDASWQQIARDQVAILGDAIGTELRRTDYHTVAEGYGGRGILLTDPSQIDGALDEAKKLAAEGTPVCINVHLASSDFREGSMSI